MFCRHCGAKVEDHASFCVKCGAAIHSPADSGAAPPPQSRPSPPAINGASKGAINIRKIVHEVGMDILSSFIGFLILNVVIDLLTGYSIFVHLLRLIIDCFMMSCLFAIPDMIVIGLRIASPGDTAYEIGSTQDEQTNRMFEQKYERFKSIANIVIWIVVVALQIYFFYTTLCAQYPKEMQELRDLLSGIPGD